MSDKVPGEKPAYTAVKEYFRTENTHDRGTLSRPDYFLAYMWDRGFKITALKKGDHYF